MQQSLSFYPVVGLVLGALLWMFAWAGNLLNLGLAGDMLTLAALIVACGGLHLDGLMDTADGLFSGKKQSTKLEIMRDSRIGAMGVIALVVTMGLKLSFLNSLPAVYKPEILFFMPVAGRWAMVLALTLFPYARPARDGLGSSFGGRRKWPQLFAASLIFIGSALYLLGWSAGVVHLLAIALLTFLLGAWFTRVLGGLTGDTYGATCEVVEVGVLLVALLFFN